MCLCLDSICVVWCWCWVLMHIVVMLMLPNWICCCVWWPYVLGFGAWCGLICDIILDAPLGDYSMDVLICHMIPDAPLMIIVWMYCLEYVHNKNVVYSILCVIFIWLDVSTKWNCLSVAVNLKMWLHTSVLSIECQWCIVSSLLYVSTYLCGLWPFIALYYIDYIWVLFLLTWPDFSILSMWMGVACWMLWDLSFFLHNKINLEC